MALLAGFIAVGEAIAEAIAAAEAATAAAGLTEGTLAAEAFAMTAEETGAATVNTAGRMAAGYGLMADPMSMGASYAARAAAPELMADVGSMGGRAGMQAAEFVFGETNTFALGAGAQLGRSGAQAAVAGIPARLTVSQARAAYAAFREKAEEHGIPNPYSGWEDFARHHHSGEGPFSPQRGASNGRSRGRNSSNWHRGGLDALHRKKESTRLVSTFNQLFSTMARSSNLLPYRKTVTHRYSSPRAQISIPATTSDLELDTLKLNSIFEPGAAFNTADTHEPLGYSQYSAMYDKYYVKEARIVIDYFNDESSAQTTYSGIILGLTPKDDTSGLTNLGYYEELPHSVWRAIGPETCGRMTYAIQPNKFFGVSSKAISASDKLVAASSGDPTELLYLHMWAHRMNESNADAVNVLLQVTVEYDVVWMEPKSLAQS